MTAAAPALSVRGLRKRYGDNRGVDDVSFDVATGEIFGLLGPNGSGKTTTVECLQGLRRADGGDLRVLGLDPRTHVAQLRRRIGSQLQESSLPDHIRVGEALELVTSIGERTPWRTLLDEWGLGGREKARFSALSGGQRQRLFIAMALANNPELVFLDEMTTGLDPAARRVAWGLISAIRDRGTTVVLVTHFMDEAEALCDRMAVLSAGQVVALGTAQQLVAAHAGRVTVRFTLPNEQDAGWLADVPLVDAVDRHRSQVHITGSGAVLAHVGHALVERGILPEDLRAEQPSLEDAYLALTGEAVT